MLVGNTIVLLVADSLATYIAICCAPSGAVLDDRDDGNLCFRRGRAEDGSHWRFRAPAPGRPIYYVAVIDADHAQFEILTNGILRIFGIRHAHHQRH